MSSALIDRLLFRDIDLAQTLLEHFELFCRNFLLRKLRILALRVGDDLIKLFLINRLLEKLVDLGVSDLSGLITLLLKVILSDDIGFLELQLALHVRRFINAVCGGLFSNSQQTVHVLRKILSSSLVNRQPRTHLSRLIFCDHCHVFSR